MKTLRLTAACLSLVISQICTADDSNAVTVQVYTVADLVVESPDSSSSKLLKMVRLTQMQQSGASVAGSTTEDDGETKHETKIRRNMEELADVIRAATVPSTWDSSGGGQGSVIPYSKTRSLIIRQTPEGHAEVTELLERLRREYELQIESSVENRHFPSC